MKCICVITAVATLFGCSKENQNSNDIKENEVEQKIIEVSSAANPNNPYDRYGELHNSGLLFVIQKMDSAKRYGIADVGEFTRLYVSEQTQKIDKTDYAKSIITRLRDSANYYRSLIEKEPISIAAKKYVSGLIDCVKKYRDNPSYASFRENVITVEKAVYSDKSISKDEVKRILQAASITRYSGYFWTKIIPVTSKSRFLAGLVGTLADVSGCFGAFRNVYSYIGGDEIPCDPISMSAMMYNGVSNLP